MSKEIIKIKSTFSIIELNCTHLGKPEEKILAVTVVIDENGRSGQCYLPSMSFNSSMFERVVIKDAQQFVNLFALITSLDQIIDQVLFDTDDLMDGLDDFKKNMLENAASLIKQQQKYLNELSKTLPTQIWGRLYQENPYLINGFAHRTLK